MKIYKNSPVGFFMCLSLSDCM